MPMTFDNKYGQQDKSLENEYLCMGWARQKQHGRCKFVASDSQHKKAIIPTLTQF